MSSNDSHKVDVVRDNGHRLRWYKGQFYRKEGNKYVFNSDKAKYYVFGVLIFLIVGVMFKESPNEESKSTSFNPSIQGINHNNELRLNSYSDIKEVKPKVVKKSKRVFERLSVVSSQTKVQIPLGAQARGVLVTGGTNGPIKVKLLEDLISHGEIYIKEGSILWGQGQSIKERLLVKFSKYVDEDGKSKKISANAFDISDQILGLKGSVIGRTSKKIMAGAGLGFAGALQTMQQSENMGGVAVVKPNIENALLNGASNAALGMAEQELEDLKNSQEIIEVPQGTKLLIVFGEV